LQEEFDALASARRVEETACRARSTSAYSFRPTFEARLIFAAKSGDLVGETAAAMPLQAKNRDRLAFQR
jgi:hypothetical protein